MSTDSAISKPANTAAVRVAVGPLMAPVLGRVMGVMAARASCPVERLDGILAVADALAAHAGDHLPNGRLGLDVTARERSLDVRVGPLKPQKASTLLAQATLPGVGNIVEQMADAVSVAPTDDGKGELLVIHMDFSTPTESG